MNFIQFEERRPRVLPAAQDPLLRARHGEGLSRSPSRGPAATRPLRRRQQPLGDAAAGFGPTGPGPARLGPSRPPIRWGWRAWGGGGGIRRSLGLGGRAASTAAIVEARLRRKVAKRGTAQRRRRSAGSDAAWRCSGWDVGRGTKLERVAGCRHCRGRATPGAAPFGDAAAATLR